MLQQAMACTLMAGKFRGQLLGDSQEFAECMEQLGRICRAAERCSCAYLGRSFVMRRRIPGEDHPLAVRSDELCQVVTSMDDDPDYLRELEAQFVCEMLGCDREEFASDCKGVTETRQD